VNNAIIAPGVVIGRGAKVNVGKDEIVLISKSVEGK
jgi:hypothetical protein